MSDRPKPSEIHVNQYATPFVGCFGRAEREMAAAVYVLACKERGDTWQPINPPMFGETLVALVRNPEGPSWAKAIPALGITPDILGLVENGFMERGEEESVTPTDAFFAKVDTPRWVRRACSHERPRPADHKGAWFHPLAREVGDQQDGYPGGDIVRYECPACGTSWKEELPQ